MNRRQWIIIVVISLLALLAGVLTSQWIHKTGLASDPAVKAFFANSWQSPDGKPVDTQKWQGKVLVVNFWASWCPPCVEEMPTLDKLQQEFLQQNVLFVGIGIDSSSNIKHFSEKHKITFPLLIAGMQGTELSRELGNQAGGLPFTVLLDGSGQIRHTYLGKLNMEKLRADIAGL